MPKESKFKPYYDAMGPKITELRVSKGLSLEEVAEKCGITVEELSSMEAGNLKATTLKTFFTLADVLDVDPLLFKSR